MENQYQINIAKDFNDKLGARYKYEGEWSGELFLEEKLLPKFEKAVEDGEKLIIELDGVLGYPSSFISGSFGKLSVLKGKDLLKKHIEFVSSVPMRSEKIISEINNPKKK